MVNSVVLGLHVLSDSFESPRGNLEVYRQPNGPCEAHCVLSQGTQRVLNVARGYKSLLQPMTGEPQPLI